MFKIPPLVEMLTLAPLADTSLILLIEVRIFSANSFKVYLPAETLAVAVVEASIETSKLAAAADKSISCSPA